MRTVSEATRKRIEAQGFKLSDEEIIAFNYWLRVAPASCMLWMSVSLIFGSAVMAAALVPVALACFALSRHPFDAFYNYGLRYLTGGEKLPLYGAPRRFVCLLASGMVASIAVSFGLGFVAVGYLIGTSMVALLLLNVLTGNCGPCVMYNRLVGAVPQNN